jgi:hypothetical protein
MSILMTAKEFIDKAVEISKTKTAYMWGTSGRPLTDGLITAKKKQYPKRYTTKYVEKLRALVGQGYHAWDCVGLIKGILWGWDGKRNVPYGARGVPDTDTVGMRNRCTHRSTDFSKIIPGCMLFKPGHVGIYIGDGLAVEATSAWESKVMITAVANIGKKTGYRSKSWTEHGRLPWIDYGAAVEPEPEQGEAGMKKVQVITPRGLNVRAKATTRSERLRTLPTGTVVDIEKESGSWGYVPAYNGWIHLGSRYVKVLETVKVEPKPEPVPAPKIELTLAEKAREWAGENILKPGMTGKLVEVVQWALMLKDYDVILIDGIFGDVTKKQIIKFQADMGLVTDGYVGPVTLEALMK